MPDYVGEVIMRSGDQLPTLGIAIEDDMGNPLNLTDAQYVDILVLNPDGIDPREDPTAPVQYAYVLPADIVNPTAGLVVHDWDLIDTLRPAQLQIIVVVNYADGTRVAAPSDRSARLSIRPDPAYDVLAP